MLSLDEDWAAASYSFFVDTSFNALFQPLTMTFGPAQRI